MKSKMFLSLMFLIVLMIMYVPHTAAQYINEIAYSPDGTRLAVAGSIWIWIYDAQTSEELNLLTGHTDYVNSVSFSPDGNTLASGSGDRTIRLWDVETGDPIRTLTGHTHSVRSVSFSPDGNTLASGSWDGTLRLWNAETGDPIRTLTGHTGDVHNVSFSPDGNTLASGGGGWDETIRLWEVATGAPIRTLIGHTDYVNSVSFSPDGNTLASGSDDRTIRLWDVSTGDPIRTLTGYTRQVESVSFSPDGNTLASGSADDTVRLWEVNTGELIRTLIGHTSDVNSVSFSPDGNTLASGSLDRTVMLWDMVLIAADVNGDSVVNIQDLVLVASRFGETGENETDVNADSVVNIQDLVLVAGAFGEGAAASPAYKNGAKVLEPVVEGAPDIEPPRVVGGTVTGGDSDIDPEALNAYGIEIEFSKDVTGNIALQTEGGEDVGWLGKVDGNTATLEIVEGKEISYERTYVIEGEISDAAGNKADIQITFVTASRVLPVAIENLLYNNLVAHWSFDRFDTDGDWVFDSSGNGNDGTIIGQPKLIKGMFGDALNFDGENDTVVVPDYAVFGKENITLMGWFNPNDAVTNRPLIVKKGSFSVGFTNNDELQFVAQPNDTSVESVSRFQVGEWIHFAVTYDGKTMQVYIDGELQNEQPNDIPIAQSEDDLVIGEGFTGSIDAVGFYNKALTEDEIVFLMEEGYFW